LSRHPVIITAKRSLALSKTYILASMFIAANALLVSPVGDTLTKDLPTSSGIDIHESLALLSIPLLAISTLTLTVPVILLYVYDKNNGVLERFLSLGMNQLDIYRRYLKASLLLASAFLSLLVGAYVSVGLFLGRNGTTLFEAAGLLVVLSISVVTLLNVAMMAFSSLQKQRVGANQPVGLAIGGLVVLPDYVIPFVFSPSQIAIIVELVIALLIAGVAAALLLLSSRLISREKLLP